MSVPFLARRHSLPFAGVCADYLALPMNGDVLTVRGQQRFEVPVTIYATSYWGELEPTLLQLLGFVLSPTGRLVHRKTILGDMSVAEFEADGQKSQELSVSAAILAAGELLGLPGSVTGEGCRVDDLDMSGPAAGILQQGDVITHVDGVKVSTLVLFLEKMSVSESGLLQVTSGLREAGEPRRKEVRLERSAQGHFGISVSTHRQQIFPGLDAEVTFPPNMGGASCGLAAALSLVDVLTPGSLTGGKRVGVTGAIGPDGGVLAIGGAELKVLTACKEGFSMFLVPQENRAAAHAAARGRLEVVGVSTLQEAVDTLVERGGTPPVQHV